MKYPWQVTFYAKDGVTILKRIVVMAQCGAEEALKIARDDCDMDEDVAFNIVPFGDEIMYGYFGYDDDKEVRA